MKPASVLCVLAAVASLAAATTTEYSIDNLHVVGKAGELGGVSHLNCSASPNSTILYWQKNGTNVTTDARTKLIYSQSSHSVQLDVEIADTTPDDSGEYTCLAVVYENRDIVKNNTISLNATLEGKIVKIEDARVKKGDNASLTCFMEGFPLTDVNWSIKSSGLTQLVHQNILTDKLNVSRVVTNLKFIKVNEAENGTYYCQAVGSHGVIKAPARLFVLTKPTVKIDKVLAVGAKALFVNWTASDGNEPIKHFFLKYMKKDGVQWQMAKDMVGGRNRSYLLTNLEPETAYKVSVEGKNAVGEDESVYAGYVTTLAEDPEFIPAVQVKGTTSDSVSIGWTSPRPDVRDFVHFYELYLSSKEPNTTLRSYYSAESMADYMFQELKPLTTYTIKLRACSEYTRQCGNWSHEVNGTTSEGVPDAPVNMVLECRYDNISRNSYLLVTWERPPSRKNIDSTYRIEMRGEALFRNAEGEYITDTRGPDVRNSESETYRFENVVPNTNYTVSVAIMQKQSKKGKSVQRQCRMPPTAPHLDQLHFDWDRVEADGRFLLRLNLRRISERTGPIRCYKVYLVKMLPGHNTKLPISPEDMPIDNYEKVRKHGGAYIADAIDTQTWHNQILLGDGRLMTEVRQCIITARKSTVMAPPAATTPPPMAEIPGLSTSIGASDDYPEFSSEADYGDVYSTVASLPLRSNALDDPSDRDARSADEQIIAYDGELDTTANYTGFVEVLVTGDNEALIPAYSGYLQFVTPSPVVGYPSEIQQDLTIALHVLIGLVIIVVILLVVLIILHNYTKTVSEEQGIDMTFTNTLMHLCRHVGGRHVPVSSSPPDMPPIARKDLAAAVAERHKDSDYGFQHEFELLPDRFSDRTTRASEARENMYKNRYPDIKAYDQTRVRLSLVDNTLGSDYINANYVIGYKERKKFVCAQGPMELTVNDFWRLVWEQNLEMILMLTNLEEYSKTKCAQYWPDASAGTRKFAELAVTHVKETRFADYLVRELKVKLGEGEERNVVQYHYLVWKDFMAPDNPAGILKFVRRINEAYSLNKGPILVHCSAGVGRTGTLVALDSLLQQLREEDQVAVFNTVCDLRHQRNFLVQSLKQYIFIYRALLEVSLTGDTEIKLAQLKTHVERMRGKENGKDRCPLEDEFDKLIALKDERAKSWTVASSEENKAKNRNPDLLPLDRNRVMLSPVPGRDHSTYINASFIEGYDSADSLIITQDPLPNTLADFWRMVSEHSVHTIVMLSDLGEGAKKCIRYWPEPDDESVYDNIKVRYIQSECCPYYTRREFSVTNLKSNDTMTTTQFQYNGWPTVEGVLPEVTRGMIELVDQTTEHHMAALQAAGASPGPLAVHCNWGADRSSIFTALFISVAQLKTERAVDVFCVARKLRTQRAMMLDTFQQYDFVHRALLNYAELHHMADNGSAASPL